MILIFERNFVTKKEIRCFVESKMIDEIVLASLDDGLRECLTLDSDLFNELNNLKGPIILYGKCRDEDAVFLGRKYKVFKRSDIYWMESIFDKDFLCIYKYLHNNSARFFEFRNNLFK